MAERITKVLIVGYPKSGNTWLTRLCAELLQCPVAGYWQSDGYEIAKEGEDRQSDYRCYKSHHTYDELQSLDEKADKVIYVYRDPRDVYMSGMHYFYDLDPLKPKQKTWISRFINRVYKELIGNRRMSDKMSKALLNGDERVHYHCRISWLDHLSPFANDDSVLTIRYEDVLDDGLTATQKICSHLGITRTDEELNTAIEQQSFTTAQKRYESTNDTERRDFMRKGTSGQWRAGMPDAVKLEFEKTIGQDLVRLKYPLK